MKSNLSKPGTESFRQTFCGEKHLIDKIIRLYGAVNLCSCLCETSVVVASKVFKKNLKQFMRKTVRELNLRKIQHSAGKELEIYLNILRNILAVIR